LLMFVCLEDHALANATIALLVLFQKIKGLESSEIKQLN